MRDVDIRTALATHLTEWHRGSPDFMLVEEMGLCQGQTRVDLVAFNGRLHGYEIKSPADTLRRLPQQVALYSRVLDRASIVCDESRTNEASTLVYSWWGIIEASEGPNGIVFREVRPAADNPCRDPSAVVALLWRDECLALLGELQAAAGLASKPRSVLWSSLAALLPLEELCQRVRLTIQSRSGWRETR
jgi:hypothetical protein